MAVDVHAHPFAGKTKLGKTTHCCPSQSRSFFCGNPSKWGPSIINYLHKERYHVVGVAETHLLGEALAEPSRKLAQCGYHCALTAAVPYGDIKAAGGTVAVAQRRLAMRALVGQDHSLPSEQLP